MKIIGLDGVQAFLASALFVCGGERKILKAVAAALADTSIWQLDMK